MEKVLFVCVENAARSQMAEGFARKLGGDILEVYSAGSKPSGKVDPMAIEVMKESGVDISGQKSKGFVDIPVEKFDYVITMGCQDFCPFYPGKESIEWEIPDPKGQSLPVFRQVRDGILKKVEDFISNVRERHH